MKTASQGKNRYETLRNSALDQMAGIGPFIEGTMCAVKRRGCKEPGWQLTFKVKGKTQTVYVPMAMVPEAKAWIREYKRLKQLIRKVTQQSLSIIRRHVANRRAEKRGRASISR